MEPYNRQKCDINFADEGCNCDAGLEEWMDDSGMITDRSLLPITRLHVGAEDAAIHIGPLATQKGMKYVFSTKMFE